MTSLGPGLLTDVVSANIALNLMDPLVRLNDELEPQGALAERWNVSEDAKTVTFTLRGDGRWTNREPVTAADFEYSWKRILDPELAPVTPTSSTGLSVRPSTTAARRNARSSATKSVSRKLTTARLS